MTWRNRPMMGFDTETTGVSVETDRIVTACIGIASQTGWSAHTWLLTQPEPIPAEATAIHGITTEHANEYGVDPKIALAKIRDDLYKGWSLGMPLVGYNIRYDLTILDRNLRRHNLGGLDIQGPVLDPFVIDKAVDTYRRGSRKLVDVCAHYGVVLSMEDAHGAEADARAACRLMWHLGRAVAGNGVPLLEWDLPSIHAWQQREFADQRRSFARYLAKQGKSLDDPSEAWPLVPLAGEEVAA